MLYCLKVFHRFCCNIYSSKTFPHTWYISSSTLQRLVDLLWHIPEHDAVIAVCVFKSVPLATCSLTSFISNFGPTVLLHSVCVCVCGATTNSITSYHPHQLLRSGWIATVTFFSYNVGSAIVMLITTLLFTLVTVAMALVLIKVRETH